ncbi:thioredoxin 1 [Moryella indoligenes]|uniref:Thioredoxin n=1 Tax=Moryella indoligenes TaxID=371674 RepID=A0AAE3V9T3_9FIRM|nr:thioredoxin 1 [Moryella indoligenes]
MVKQLSEANFETEVLKSEKPVLVDFYADWCGPCKMTAPVLDKLAEMVDNVSFVKINVDENQNLAAKYQVMTIPNLVVFKNGEVVTRAIGAQNLDALKALIEKAL